ncbi:ead/Ea22-like family protein [Salmonella enterica subsp. enterica]|nr:ead/Ea22-like family protein [Salmonella enterica subsp. enterica]
MAESVDREEWDVLDNSDADYQVIVSGSLERGTTYRSYQPVANGISEQKIAAFIAAFNPKVALALLDKNLQLQREKDAIEAVALALRDDMRQAREQLEAAEKRNAEQREYYEGVIADGSKRIAELEAREISLPERSSMLYRTDFHEDYHTVMAYKVSDVIAAIRAAGIKVKES